MHCVTWQVLTELQYGQPRKVSDLCCPLFALSEVNISSHGKKTNCMCFPFGMFLTLVYTEHSHAATAGQTQ